MFSQALEIMGIGIGVVFVMLAVFFVVMKLLMRIFPAKDDSEE